MGSFNPDLTTYIPTVYPAAAAAATVATAGVAWNWAANYTELIAASAITSDYYLEGVAVSVSDLAQTYQIRVGYGSAGAEVVAAEVAFHPTTGVTISHAIMFGAKKIPANARLAFNATDSEAAANTVSLYAIVRKAS